MKSLFLSLLLIHLYLSPVRSQSNTQQVWNLVVALDQALVQKDSTRLHQLLSNDFIGAIPSGQTYTKAQYIRFHCRPQVGLVSVRQHGPDQAVIRIYGDAAVVNRRVDVENKAPDGTIKSYTVQRIEVCVYQSGRWLVAAGQGTAVAVP